MEQGIACRGARGGRADQRSETGVSRRALPSVDRLLREPGLAEQIAAHGRAPVLAAVREELAALRAALIAEDPPGSADAIPGRIAHAVSARLAAAAAPSLKRVFNLSGTILHTNLGRALLPADAIAAMALAARHPTNLEYDLEAGARGERDRHLEALLVRLTGAERATAVNNNAAAVLLVLNTLALRREVIVSRGELIEIGGEFRLPAIVQRAGCRMVEVGTTNRTHLRDYAEAIGARTALILKVHPSNYRIEGFASSVHERTLAALARERRVALVSDLGAGALVDLRRWGLPHEPTPAEALGAGADLVTFSGDKLLGGPQAGLIAGRRDLIERVNRNALKRTLRLDKLRIAALEALLRLYLDPDRLAERLPTLRSMSRKLSDLEALAGRLKPALERALGERAAVAIEACPSQAGSGSLPGERLPSVALAIRPRGANPGGGSRLERLARAFRSLPIPVIGRAHQGALFLDLRTLEDEGAFLAQLEGLGAALA
jgi:L-seryl-tRNA(Ser) seleniumtransferase